MLNKVLNRLCQSASSVLLSCIENLLPFLIMSVAGSEPILKILGDKHPLAAKRKLILDTL